MSGAGLKSRRSGGRKARLAARLADEHDGDAPVRPGLVGGRYQPLSGGDIQRIYDTALDLLETIGMGSPIASFVEVVTRAGGDLTDSGRLLFPRDLIRRAVDTAAKRITVYGFDPAFDLEISGERVHFGTGGAAVHMYDPLTNEFAHSNLVDLYDLARLYHHMDHLNFFLRPIVAREMEGPRELDINTAYAVMAATTKPVASSFFDPAHVSEVVEIADAMLGETGAFRKRPFLHAANTFVVPPLRYAEESCECLVAQVRAGMMPMLVSAGQAGATSPAALAGSLVQSLAECLSGLAIVNLLVPGHPATMGMWPFVSDLRTGAMSGGSGEEALLTAASAQIVNWLGLPSAQPAGMTDAKQPDNQAGYEKGVTVALTAAAGANMIYESASMLASILSSSREALVIDNDMLGMINRTVRGIEVSDQTLSVETIRNVVYGEGHFLGSEQTLSMMQTEYLYPEVASRLSLKEWGEADRPELLKDARARVRDILASYYPTHVPLSVHEDIHRKHPIRLPMAELDGSSRRWRE